MNTVTVSVSFPPNIEKIREHFKLTGDEVFCYGSTIYNPSQKDLTVDLFEHELVHVAQQSENTEAWWALYLKDPLFRSAEEIPAYQKQYQIAKKIIKDKNRLFKYLRTIALNLSGETYGNCLTFTEAMEAIQKEELFDIKNLAKQ